MVAVITGLGLERGSGFVLGSRGQLGSASFGRYGENVYVNAATGNLAIQRNDEMLIGLGLDDSVTRSYNSLGTMSDDNGDNWQLGATRSVVNFNGTLNTAGSTVHRLDWDGSDVLYTWDTTKNAYVANQGSGSYDTLTYTTATGVWTWTDGNSRVVETYPDTASYGHRIVTSSDADGNQLTYSYTGALLTRVTTANGEHTDYSYSGNNLTQVVTTLTGGATLTRVRYTYDGSNRLQTVTTDLTPNDNSISDGNTVVTTYTYDGTSKRVASIGQTGGALLAIGYTLVGSIYRVASLTQTQASGVADTTSFSYDTTNSVTTITDPLGQVSKMTYDSQGQLTRLEQPAVGGVTHVSTFTYDTNGNVTTATDGAGNTTNYAYDANGNIPLQRDAAGNTIARSFGSKNELLTETYFFVPDPDGGGNASPSRPVSTRYAYDAENHLRFAITATGGVTEYQYDGYGRRISAITYTGTAYDVSGLSYNVAPSEATLASWRDTTADNTAIQVTDTTYDARGNVATTTTYDSLNTSRVRYSLFQNGGSTTGWTIGYDPNHIQTGSLTAGITQGLPYLYTNFTATAAGQTISIATAAGSWFPVVAGERLSVQAGVGASGPINALQIVVQWSDANGNVLTGATVGTLTGPHSFNSRISGFVTPPAGAVVGRLELYCNTSGSGTGVVNFTQPMVARASANQTTIPVFAAHGGNAADTSPNTLDGLTYHRITYTYDQAGNLLTRQDNRSSATASYIHDGLGRLIGSTDLGGNSTRIAFTDSTNTLLVTTANLATTTSVYDAAGEMISSSINGPGVGGLTTNYAYDADGQLRMVTDPLGQKSYYLYDADGNKIADITADGSLTEYGYDGSDRLTYTLHYALKLSTTQLGSLIDANGKPTGVTLASIRPAFDNGDRWDWNIFDHADRLIETINGVGSATVYSYDGASRLVATTSYANYVAIASFKSVNALPTTLQIPTADSVHDRTTRYFYDDAGRQTGVLGADGSLTQTLYDAAGRKIRQIAYANFTDLTLRASGTLTQLVTAMVTTSNDHRVDYVYDDAGQLRYTIDANGRPVGYSYDASGNVVHVTDYAQSIGVFASYSLYWVTSQIATLNLDGDANNRTTRSIYDVNGRVAFAIDATGGVKAFAYDGVGNILKQTGYSVAYASSGDPGLSTMQGWASANASAANDRIIRTLYDGWGRVVYVVDAENYVTETQYDHDSHVSATIRYAAQYTVTDSTTWTSLKTTIGSLPTDAVVTSYTYDVAGRLSTVTDGTGSVTLYIYDALGDVLYIQRGYGTSDVSKFQRRYDAAGRVTSISDPADVGIQFTVKYGYDALGNIKTFTDGLNNVTNKDYDSLGRLIKVTDPLGGVTSYQYDAFGNIVATTDPRGNTGYSYYDDLDRLVLQVDPEGYDTETSYSIDGAVKSVTRRYSRVSGTYNVTSRPTVNTSASDETTSFTLDKLDRVTRVTDAEGYYENYTLDAFGNRVQVRNKLGGITTNVFDQRGELLSETLTESSVRNDGTVAATSVTNSYTYDARGNRRTMIEAAGLAEQRTTTYAYDKMDRLTTTTHDAVQVLASNLATVSTVTPVETLAYDRRGNVIQRTDASGASTFIYYDLLDRKIAEVNAAGALSTWSYDLNGNVTAARVYGDGLTTTPTAGGTPPNPVNASNYRETTYTYDKNNRLQTSTIANVLTGEAGPPYNPVTGSIVSSNVYDASGNLVQTIDARGNSSYYFYDRNGRKIAEVDALKYLTSYTLDGEGNVTREERFATALTGTVAATSDPNALRSSVTGNAADRITQFTYDRNGRRVAEQRLNVVAWTVNGTNGALTQAAATATVGYTYNGLGEVLTKTEATGDATTYGYDAMGRQTSVTGPAISDYQGNTVQRLIENFYDGLNNLTRTQVDSTTAPSSQDRVTTYSYGAGGRLASMTDASGFTRNYAYDVPGHVVRESYVRTRSDGTTVTEANGHAYDIMGRQVSQWVATLSGSTWNSGDIIQTAYGTYGEVSARGVNGLWQQRYDYDAAGRVWRATANDGTTHLFLRDANGNVTLEVTATGTTDLASSSTTMQGIIGQLTGMGNHAVGTAAVSGLVVTFSFVDQRSQTVWTSMPFRDLGKQADQSLKTSTLDIHRAYNAFGEVIQDNDANGGITNYTYNTEGKLISSQAPTTNATAENGGVTSARPTQTNYYDVSGRLVGIRDANGNVNTLTLVAGTGYGGDDADVLKEFHADGGTIANAYDVFGDKRTSTVHLLAGDSGKTESYVYDAMDRLTEQDHQARGAGSQSYVSGGTNQLIDHYVYDGLGQRIQHWNNLFGSSYKETTDYDSQGRIVSTKDFMGTATSYVYGWDGSKTTAGLGTAGGWSTYTLNSAGRSSIVYNDYFGHDISRTDFGGHSYTLTYDKAAHLVGETNSAGENTSYAWFNTGLLAGVTTTTSFLENGTSYNRGTASTYGYDKNGNRVTETTIVTLTDPYIEADHGLATGTYSMTDQSSTATWDAMNRMTQYTNNGENGGDHVTVNYEYDLASNVRRANATYTNIGSGTPTTSDYWYRYDGMNRFLTTRGTFTGTAGSGAISRGTTGTDISYDYAGNRLTATSTVSGNAQEEDYAYTDDGYLGAVRAGTGTPVPRAQYTRDVLGRATGYVEYLGDGTTLNYSRTATSLPPDHDRATRCTPGSRMGRA